MVKYLSRCAAHTGSPRTFNTKKPSNFSRKQRIFTFSRGTLNIGLSNGVSQFLAYTAGHLKLTAKIVFPLNFSAFCMPSQNSLKPRGFRQVFTSSGYEHCFLIFVSPRPPWPRMLGPSILYPTLVRGEGGRGRDSQVVQNWFRAKSRFRNLNKSKCQKLQNIAFSRGKCMVLRTMLICRQFEMSRRVCEMRKNTSKSRNILKSKNTI